MPHSGEEWRVEDSAWGGGGGKGTSADKFRESGTFAVNVQDLPPSLFLGGGLAIVLFFLLLQGKGRDRVRYDDDDGNRSM